LYFAASAKHGKNFTVIIEETLKILTTVEILEEYLIGNIKWTEKYDSKYKAKYLNP
jgi:hypothetical protein